MPVNGVPSECLERDRPRPECEGRPSAKSTVSTTESMRCSVKIRKRIRHRSKVTDRREILRTDYGARELLVDELEESSGVSRGLHEASFVDGRGGHCDCNPGGGGRSGLGWKDGTEGEALYRPRVPEQKLTRIVRKERLNEADDDHRPCHRSQSPDPLSCVRPERAARSPKLREFVPNLIIQDDTPQPKPTDHSAGSPLSAADRSHLSRLSISGTVHS